MRFERLMRGVGSPAARRGAAKQGAQLVRSIKTARRRTDDTNDTNDTNDANARERTRPNTRQQGARRDTRRQSWPTLSGVVSLVKPPKRV
eukprot:3117329-Prymnesium_polylepis.1